MRHVRNIRTDATPTGATCSQAAVRTGPHCTDTYCPRHSPVDYADCMARHAVDSLPNHITREMQYHMFGVTR